MVPESALPPVPSDFALGDDFVSALGARLVTPPRTGRPARVAGATAGALLTAPVGTLSVRVPAAAAQAAPVLLSQGKPVPASSQENHGTPASDAVDGKRDRRWSSAVDGNRDRRWSSAASDPQWVRIDLGAATSVSQVLPRWEADYAKACRIALSTDGTNCDTAYSTTPGAGHLDAPVHRRLHTLIPRPGAAPS
ncbi:discoidin domain-containing protein [Streptomyces sp. NPDC006309]|uniref:discoidin domain-containing protein n=1 Tax=Streptomyces sp. NPDC006309 TaxID=3156749 RepID=UPI00339DAB37